MCLDVNPWPQDGLTIENPEGFSSEYLLKASKLMIDLDMQKLITSWGKTLEVEKAVYLKLWVANGKKGGFQKPRCCSMYSIFIYIWLIYGVNVGKYSIARWMV